MTWLRMYSLECGFRYSDMYNIKFRFTDDPVSVGAPKLSIRYKRPSFEGLADYLGDLNLWCEATDFGNRYIYDFSKYRYRVYLSKLGPENGFVLEYAPSTVLGNVTTLRELNGSFELGASDTLIIERQSRNNAPNVSLIPTQSTTLGTNKTVNLANYFSDADNDALTYTTSSNPTGIATVSVSGSTLTLAPLKVGSTTVTVTANDGKGGVKSTNFTFNVTNNAPTVTITAPTGNQTLREKDTLTLAGNTKDVDVNNTVTVKYQIDSGAVRNLHSAVSDGVAPIEFTQTLTYKDGVLHDGQTDITSILDKDIPHIVSIWAEDEHGGKSSVITRTFFVVPNRPPSVTVDPIAEQTDLINSNAINVNGTVTDADNNDVTVTFSINGGTEQQVHQGPPAAFTFNILLADLKVGANTVIIKATDIYNKSGTKTLTINKTHNAVPVNKAVARYLIEAPTGKASSILLWITRTLGNLGITAEVSMTGAAEAENYIALDNTNSAVVNGLKEEEFAYKGTVEKEKIVLKITYDRTDAGVVDTIKQISGVLF